jgi:transposase
MQWTVAIGIDTHKDEHVAVALDRLGRQLDTRAFAATSGGYAGLYEWAQELGGAAFAIEGCGSYGAGLAAFLVHAGADVYECERPRRAERRRGKSDFLDALRAARRLLGGEGLSRPRGGGQREDLRLLLLERRGARRAHTAALNQLHALVLTAPDDLRTRLQQLSGAALIKTLARQKRAGVLAGVLTRTAERARQLEAELDQLDHELQRITGELAPELLAECGVGPVTAAQLIVSSGDPQRMANEASFAALAGTSPVDASSGRQQRHRLNRGGDRQLNQGLHVIALNRIRFHPTTNAYYQRLTDSGKTSREARRCIKRALARHFYRKLCSLPQLALTP